MLLRPVSEGPGVIAPRRDTALLLLQKKNNIALRVFREKCSRLQPPLAHTPFYKRGSFLLIHSNFGFSLLSPRNVRQLYRISSYKRYKF